jgi:hypothetical protein
MWYHNAKEQNLNAVWTENEAMKLVRLVKNSAFGI